jgi:hypothetical protein
VLSTLCVWGALVASADPDASPEGLFYIANDFYQRALYTEAAERYESILQHGVENGALYYNLGNAWLKSGHVGQAIWAYLQASRWIPRDPDLQSNLTYAQSRATPGETMRVPRVIRWATCNGHYTPREVAWWMTRLIWVAMCCWIVMMWVVSVRALMRPMAWGLSLLAGGLGVMLLTQTVWEHARPRGVLVAATPAKFAPQAAGTTHFTLSEGAVVYRTQQQGQWLHIQRADGRSGWIEATALRMLTDDE